MNVRKISDTVSKGLLTTVMPSWGGINTPNMAFVSQKVVDKKYFETAIVEKVDILLETDEWLDNNLPRISEKDLNFFKARSTDSIINVGTEVSCGDLLVAKVKKIEPKNSKERLVENVFGQIIENTGVSMGFYDKATVVSTERVDNKISIYLLIKRNLSIGDTIFCEEQKFLVAGILREKEMPVLEEDPQIYCSIVVTSSILSEEKTEKENFRNIIKNKKDDRILLSVREHKNGRSYWVDTKEKAYVDFFKFNIQPGLVEAKSQSVGMSGLFFKNNMQLDEGVLLKETFIQKAVEKGLEKSVSEWITIGSDEGVSLEDSFCLLQGMGFLPEIIKGEKPYLRVSKITTAEILALSKGEVTTPDYFSDKACTKFSENGLFCEKIFGTEKKQDIFRRSFGHIALAVPVPNPIFQDETSVNFQKLFKEFFSAKNLECSVELDSLFREVFYPKNNISVIGVLKQCAPFEGTVFLENVLVIPAGFRMLGKEKDGTYSMSTIDVLYRRIIIRNNRFKRLLEIKAPIVILVNEYCMLVSAVRSLFSNTKTQYDKAIVVDGKIFCKSLDKMYQETVKCLFTKKCAYTGVSVVVPSVDLYPYEIFLPARIALKIFELPISTELLRERKVGEYEDYLDQKQPILESLAKTRKEAKQKIANVDTDALISLNSLINQDDGLVIVGMLGEELASFKVKIWDNEVVGVHPDFLAKAKVKKVGEKIKLIAPISDEARKEISKDSVLFQKEAISNSVVSEKDGFKSALMLNNSMLSGIKDQKSFNLTRYDTILVSGFEKYHLKKDSSL
ncbi:MAG: hypothetical protein WCQ32_02540 [bacterium]